MRFEPTAINGVWLVEAEPVLDDRGLFARLFCPEEFRRAGISFEPRQTSLSRNTQRATLRGLHYSDLLEAKLVRCVRGRIYDVAVDIRRESPTFRKWVGFELDPERARAVFIPPGVAHGFVTLVSEADVLYQIDRIYEPGYDRGYRWNDPAFSITWPMPPEMMSERDRALPLLGEDAGPA